MIYNANHGTITNVNISNTTYNGIIKTTKTGNSLIGHNYNGTALNAVKANATIEEFPSSEGLIIEATNLGEEFLIQASPQVVKYIAVLSTNVNAAVLGGFPRTYETTIYNFGTSDQLRSGIFKYFVLEKSNNDAVNSLRKFIVDFEDFRDIDFLQYRYSTGIHKASGKTVLLFDQENYYIDFGKDAESPVQSFSVKVYGFNSLGDCIQFKEASYSVTRAQMDAYLQPND